MLKKGDLVCYYRSDNYPNRVGAVGVVTSEILERSQRKWVEVYWVFYSTDFEMNHNELYNVEFLEKLSCNLSV